jgi:hypothetical protein
MAYTLITEARNVKFNKQSDIMYPDLTNRELIPVSLRICELTGAAEEEIPARSLVIRLNSNAELSTYCEAYFQTNEHIDLSDFRGIIRKTGKLSFQLTNKNREPRDYRIYMGYEPSLGGQLYDETVTADFEEIPAKIANTGRCTVLTLTASRPLASLRMMTTVISPDENDTIWGLTGFEVEGHGTNSAETYVFDFTQPEMRCYVDKFRYLRLQVKEVATDSSHPLTLYVSAIGFKA